MLNRLYQFGVVCSVVLCCPILVLADNRMYHCEVGVQGGIGYYVGELAPHVFQKSSESYGAQFRYKFDQRWALQAKIQRLRIFNNPMWMLDANAEYNFFRFGNKSYDYRVKQITPYISLGVGASAYDGWNVGVYLPVGVGLKWKFADRWQLQAAWQHNVYVYNGDGFEDAPEYNNKHDLNGSNIMNNDVTSTLTIGVVFEFGKGKKICHLCE